VASVLSVRDFALNIFALAGRGDSNVLDYRQLYLVLGRVAQDRGSRGRRSDTSHTVRLSLMKILL